MLRHNGKLPHKRSSYTAKNTGLWSVFYTEHFLTRKAAMGREKELKTAKGRSFLKNLLE